MSTTTEERSFHKRKERTAEELRAIFEPKSVAVIGASTRPGSVGYDIFKNIIDGNFKGKLYGINPKGGSLGDYKLYPSISEVSDPVDLAVIIIPAVGVPEVVKECAAKGVKGIVVISAGFKETGPAGAELENEVAAIVTQHNIPLVGPNCLGIINPLSNVQINASFAKKMPKAGNIAFLTQSGALGTAVLDFAEGQKIGFSKFVSFGNKADITELDFLRYLAEDPETKVILMYLEDIADGPAFIKLARELTGDYKNKKPILALKSGRTSQGAKAAKSHTGSLAGSESAYDALFIQSGVLRVDTIEELFDYAICFASEPLPQGKRVGIVTNAGGPGIIATDAVIRNGMTIAQLSESTTQYLKENLPAAASVADPIDVLGDAKDERYKLAIDAVLNDPNVDSLMIILTPQSMTDAEAIAKIVAASVKGRKKPVVCSFMGLVDVLKGIQVLEDNQIPNFIFPESAARGLAGLEHYSKWIHRERGNPVTFKVDKARAQGVFDRIRQSGRYEITEYEGLEVLEAYGFPVPKRGLATSSKEAYEIAKKIGKPVVMKIASPDILHKSDVGGVRLNIPTPEAAQKEYDDLIAKMKIKRPEARILGIFIAEMAEKGAREVILGIKKDPSFGPLLMFGFGGIFVEIFKDVAFRVAPIRESGAQKMIESIKSYKLLQGVRGEPPSDIGAIKEAILRLNQLAMDFAEIDELDINPLFVFSKGKGCLVVDVRILLTGNNHSQ